MNQEAKTEVPGFYKVEEGVVINKDTLALQVYKEKKRKDAEMRQIKSSVENLKNDMQEIKELLKGLVK